MLPIVMSLLVVIPGKIYEKPWENASGESPPESSANKIARNANHLGLLHINSFISLPEVKNDAGARPDAMHNSANRQNCRSRRGRGFGQAECGNLCKVSACICAKTDGFGDRPLNPDPGRSRPSRGFKKCVEITLQGIFCGTLAPST